MSEAPRATYERDRNLESGLVSYLMPDGKHIQVTPPSRYLGWPELWPNPAVEYPWRKPYGKTDRLGVRPNVHVEYVIVLSTLYGMGGSLTNPPAKNASKALEEACEPPLNGKGLTDTNVMSARLGELEKMGYIRSVKPTPQAKRRREIHLTKSGRALIESGLLPLAYEVAASRNAEAENEAENEIQAETEVETSAAMRGAFAADEPEETDGADTSPVPPSVPPAPTDEVDYGRLAQELLNAAVEAISSGGGETYAHVQAQLTEAQRQNGILRGQLQKASNAVDEMRKQRDAARAAALDAENARKDTERNLAAVMESARNGRVSPQTQDVIAKLMTERPKSR